ncbi:MAG: phytanoyl-CoA dioxygenase family protein [Proteobacteria bacterium]|jgi:hypothetical protein|nr:phytanoyl-CoA dioxygenase family protein [Pseudomonadota bacterium]
MDKAATGDATKLLNSTQMAEFAARGFVRMDGVVPDDLNRAFLDELGAGEASEPAGQYRLARQSGAVPAVPAGTPLANAYQPDTTVGKIVRLPEVSGAIQSLVGTSPLLDHHFLHMTFPPRFMPGGRATAQHTHQDSTIDPRSAFDVQIMYFPQRVTASMGGTRFIPGSHFRIVSEAAVARYQNIRGQQRVICEPGTMLFMHMGIWHGGGMNESDAVRYMFKIRLAPTERQVRLWDDSDLGNDHFEQRPIFWTGDEARDPIHAILTRPEPWFEADTGRLEYINRIRFWRYLLGDDRFDADYWMTRIENEFL